MKKVLDAINKSSLILREGMSQIHDVRCGLNWEKREHIKKCEQIIIMLQDAEDILYHMYSDLSEEEIL